MSGRRALLALLAAAPAAAQPNAPTLPTITLGRGVAALAPGAWRVVFPPEREALEPAQHAAIGRIGATLQSATTGRITLVAEANSGDDLSTHRRLTLARARAVKAALVAGGLVETRIDIRAMGRTENGRDSVDVFTPAALAG